MAHHNTSNIRIYKLKTPTLPFHAHAGNTEPIMQSSECPRFVLVFLPYYIHYNYSIKVYNEWQFTICSFEEDDIKFHK